MRKTIVAALALVVIAAGLLVAQEEKPWFDMKNCAFCKEIDAQPGLADHMRHDYFNVSNGIMSVSHIDKEYWPVFERAQAGIAKVVEGMQAGQMSPMCQHCTLIGKFHMAGVKFEEFKPDFGIVMLWTSPDTAMVTRLHAFADRNNTEFAKWKADRQQKPGN
jgi:hypothetical protein